MARRLARNVSLWRCALAALGAVVWTSVGCNPAAKPVVDADNGSSEKSTVEAADRSTAGEEDSAENSAETAADPAGAKALLDKMVAAYAKTPGYEDSGEVVLHQIENGQLRDSTIPFTTAFVRPNMLRLHVFDAAVVCDGKTFWASVTGVPGQIVKGKAPPKLSIENVLGRPVLGTALTQVVGGPVQFSLLVDEKPLDIILKNADPPRFQPNAVLNAEPCRKVEVKRSDFGSLVFWIDPETLILRRLEFDAAPPPPGETNPAPSLSWTATFHGARFTESVVADAFKYEAPADAVLVRMFDVRSPLSKLLGKQIGDFKFKGLDGVEIDRKGLTGKVAIVDFWGMQYPILGPHLQTLEGIYQKYRKNPDVTFVAVSIDPDSISNAQAAQAFANAGLTLPIARDLEQFGRHTFHVESMPSMFVIGRDGRVQYHESEPDPKLVVDLGAIIDKVLAGEETSEDCRRRYEERTREIRTVISENDAAAVEAAFSEPSVAPASEPEVLELKLLWQSMEVAKPGNLLAVGDEGGPTQVIALDGDRRVAIFDEAGVLASRHDLPLPDGAVVRRLRTGVDRDGRRLFVGFELFQRQLHAFDNDWKLRFSHPEGANDGITDVRIADLDAQGEAAIYVGYAGRAGIHRVTLDGKRLWSNREIEQILGLAVGGADANRQRGLMAIHVGRGIFTINAEGISGRPIDTAPRTLRALAAVDIDGDAQPELCGIAFAIPEDDTAIGLSPDGQELWSYDLPDGLPVFPASEGIVGGKLIAGDEAPYWVLTGPDGSLHVLGADGAPVDRWNVGRGISGLAVATLQGAPALIVASGDRVEAFRVARRP